MLAAISVGCGGHATARHAALAVSSPQQLADAAIEVRASGLKPGSSVTLNATWAGYGGVRASSSQAVPADRDGRLDLRGFDGMRILWDMHVTPAQAGFTIPARGDAPVDLALVSAGKTVAHAVVHRRAADSAVRLQTLSRAHDGLVGFFFSPADSGATRPAVMVAGGSKGGVEGVDIAALLASHGYPALALGYFGLSGLPRTLARIPLEYFQHGLRWLGRQPSVDARRLVMMGISRGGEAALLAAATFPSLVHATVALVTSSEVLPALDRSSVAWTYHGSPIPLAAIPVERARGAILIAGAGKDAVVPSSTYAKQIEQRLEDRHFAYFHERLNYPDAGHDIGSAIPYLPEPDPAHYGGSPRATALAKTKLWPRILDFLSNHA